MKKLSTKTTCTAFLLLSLARNALAGFFDKKPWCKLYPDRSSLKASPAYIDVSKDLNGDWYTIGYKKQRWDSCECSVQSFKWNPKHGLLKAWFGCESKRDEKYTNVRLRPKNGLNTKFSGWMRLSPGGSFFIPFKCWILDRASDKSWLLIGEPCRGVAFILARTRRIDAGLYASLKRRLTNKFKFDLSDFVPKCGQRG